MRILDVAILCGPENGSPRVLAETLHEFVARSGNTSQVFYRVKAFRRLLSARQAKYNPLAWFFYRIKHWLGDRELFAELKKKDAVIICDWTPNGFYRQTYNIEKLRTIIDNKPILYYAVQYVGNSPTIIQKLKDGNHAFIERYDWHMSVSDITELRNKPTPPWNQIGMNLKSTGLKPEKKDEFFAIVDFLRPGYEQYREIQVQVLIELNISYISLEKEYSLSDIRELYKKSSINFIQFPEAYGLPIAECLACGSYIGTPDSSWPMSWRLDEKVEVHGSGTLPECFVVYNGADDLKRQLIAIRDSYDLVETPKKVFDNFYTHYPSFYEGNMEGLQEVYKRIETGNFK
jgi:hypothetical protein